MVHRCLCCSGLFGSPAGVTVLRGVCGDSLLHEGVLYCLGTPTARPCCTLWCIALAGICRDSVLQDVRRGGKLGEAGTRREEERRGSGGLDKGSILTFPPGSLRIVFTASVRSITTTDLSIIC